MNLKPQTLKNGLVIVFEGVDGAGKSTQLEQAATRLKAAGWPVMTSRNLGGTPIGEALREVMLSDTPRPSETDLYISVAIQAALIESISKARQAGQIILLDRGPFSLAAYQIYGSNVSPDLAWPHVDRGVQQLQPELTLFYEGDITRLLERAKHKPEAGDYFESKPVEYFDRVSKGYREIVERYDIPVAILDAADKIDQVTKVTMQEISKAIEAKLKQL